MHQGSALHTSRFYILPLSRGPFHSLLGMVWTGWLWAFVSGLAFLIVGRRFRYDCRNRPAEWLAVALAIVLFESAYPAFRTASPGAMTGETAWIEPSAAPDSEYALGNFRDRGYLRSSDPLMYHLWWRKAGESWAELSWIALRLTAAAAMIAIAVWCLRDKLSPGWVAVLMIVIAVLVTLGPMHWPRRRRPKSLLLRRILPINRAPARNPGPGRGSLLISTHALGRLLDPGAGARDACDAGGT